MRINIEGDISQKDLLKIGQFLTELYHGRKEHINVSIEGLENAPKEDVEELTNKMFGKLPHFTMVIDGGFNGN